MTLERKGGAGLFKKNYLLQDIKAIKYCHHCSGQPSPVVTNWYMDRFQNNIPLHMKRLEQIIYPLAKAWGLKK